MPFHGLPFCLWLKTMDLVSSAVNIQDRKVSLSAFLVHIFNYQRSLTFPLLIGRVSATVKF